MWVSCNLILTWTLELRFLFAARRIFSGASRPPLFSKGHHAALIDFPLRSWLIFGFSLLLLLGISSPSRADSDALVLLPLDDGSGLLASDMSGLGNHGTLVDGALFEANTTDSSPYAVRFDGINDFIDLGAIDVSGTGLTLATWFNADSFPGPSNDPRLISKATGVSSNDHLFMLSTIRTGSVIRLRARVRVGGTTTTLIASSGDLGSGVWRHAAVTYDGAALRLYLDAVEVGSTPLTGAVDIDSSVLVAVGAQPAGAGPKFFDGLLDDVRILQRALDASELSTIVGGGNTVDSDGDNYTVNQGDCNDTNADIHPGAADVCGDGIDQDCSNGDAVCPVEPLELLNPTGGEQWSSSSAQTISWNVGNTPSPVAIVVIEYSRNGRKWKTLKTLDGTQAQATSAKVMFPTTRKSRKITVKGTIKNAQGVVMGKKTSGYLTLTR
jgi:hypothetical protein